MNTVEPAVQAKNFRLQNKIRLQWPSLLAQSVSTRETSVTRVRQYLR